MPVIFKFRPEKSTIFGQIFRPEALVFFHSPEQDVWIPIWMIVDSGADYTLLPKWYSNILGINLKKDCELFSTSGIGGNEEVYLARNVKVRLGEWGFEIPVGFLGRDTIPPLFGRQAFLEKIKTTFDRHRTIFERNS